jgi:hypothetical protein
MVKATIKERIAASLKASKDFVFLRKEFDHFGDYRQVSRAVSGLMDDGLIVRVGYGVYAKAIKSPLSGNPVPKDALVAIGLAAMRKMGIKADIGSSEKALQEGRSTQVPMLPVISVGKSRVHRKIGFGERTIAYETD